MNSLPYSLEAERSLVGSFFLAQGGNEDEIINSLPYLPEPEDFYNEKIREVYRAMLKVRQDGQPIDLVTVTEKLRTTEKLEFVGSVAFLIGLAESVPTSAYAYSYFKIIIDNSTKRKLISLSQEINSLSRGASSPTSIVDIIRKKSDKLQIQASESNWTTSSEMAQLGMDDILERRDSGITGLTTGFPTLDEQTSGLADGSFNVLAARPSMGKTACALAMAQHVLFDLKKSVAFFSLEMDILQIYRRIIAARVGIDLTRLLRPKMLSDDDISRIANVSAELDKCHLFVDDVSQLNINQVFSRVHQVKKRSDLGLIVIDYIQLMDGKKGGQSNRQEEVSSISRGCKSVAREFNVPLLGLSQLSRAVEKQTNKRPMMQHLRESGSIENDADLIIFLYRDDYYAHQENRQSEKPNTVEMIISKQRNGPTGIVEAKFYAQQAKFY